MKKITIVTAAFLLFAFTGFAQTWNWDKAHSQLNFGIQHMSISEISGTFTGVDAKMVSSAPDMTDAQIELTADVNTINTSNEQRNAHLKTADFFDAAQFGTLSFKSTSFKKVGDKNYKLEGNLTMHGVTKPVALDVVFNGTATNPMNKKVSAGFKITGIVKRSDFGIAPKMPSNFLGDDVLLKANAEFVKD
jgi:polyisoprenoid-binding protein YceI